MHSGRVVSLPNEACLREYRLLVANRIDRLRCEELSHSVEVPAEVSLGAACLGDSLRHISTDYDQRWVDWDKCKYHLCLNHLLIENLHSSVQNLSYYTSLSTVKPALEYILSKVIPQRCQGRKSAAVLLQRTRFSAKELAQIASQDQQKMNKKQLAKAADFEHTLSVLRQLVLNSLLGNYPHSDPRTRPLLAVRIKLYKAFKDGEWFDKLITEASVVVEYALRDYLVYAIPDNTGLFKHVRHLIKFDEWKPIGQKAMGIIRKVFATTFSKEHWDWVPGLKKQLNSCHAALLEVSYRRVDHMVRQQLISALKQVPMVARPGFEAFTPPLFEVPKLLAIDCIDFPDDEPNQTEEVLSLTGYISPEQYQVLSFCVKQVGPKRLGCIQRVLGVLGEGLGLTPQITNLLIQLCNAHQQPGTSPKRFREHLVILAAKQPHAYNVLQTLASIQHDLLRIRIIEDLPASYTKNQQLAIQERYGLDSTELLDQDLYFYFCPICDQVFSIICDEHSVYKAAYEYGLRDAVVDLRTEKKEVYCPRGKDNHRGQCGEKPLERIFLLGRTLRYLNKVLLLCPQKGCAMIMSLDPQLALYNERGWACCHCTKKSIKKIQAPVYEKCTICAVELKTEVYLYPYQTYLCRKHHRELYRMDQDILKAAPDQATLIAKMLAYRKVCQANATAKAALYYKKPVLR